MNDLKHLVGKPVHIKLRSITKVMACTVSSVEDSGLWISGSPILEVVVQAGAQTAAQNPVIYVPLHNVEWIVAALERGQN
jgi:hypothetical protein